jgi:hypothetical protein
VVNLAGGEEAFDNLHNQPIIKTKGFLYKEDFGHTRIIEQNRGCRSWFTIHHILSLKNNAHSLLIEQSCVSLNNIVFLLLNIGWTVTITTHPALAMISV